jgi:microtubule-associated protein-like 6
VYFLAGLGVVYSPPPLHTQRFFLGHNDDVKSCAMCPAPVTLGDVDFPPWSLVATGQVGVGRAIVGCVCIGGWGSRL